jgi:uncharacterized coiled-coil protein SlyX
MTGWSPEEAIAMERRHILEGEKRIARQETLVDELIGRGRDQLAREANELLDRMREILEFSRKRLLNLEGSLDEVPKSN